MKRRTLDDIGFGTIRVLTGQPDEKKATELLKRLTIDPGVCAVMKKYNWRVGQLIEISPIGKHSSILGYNLNQGEEIALRLRNPRGGFRQFEEVLAVLCHELAHMVHGPHNKDFHALNRKLQNEVETLNWKYGVGHRLGGVAAPELNAVQRRQAAYTAAIKRGWRMTRGHTLGGDMSATARMSQKELLATATLMRLTAQERQIEQGCGHASESALATGDTYRQEAVPPMEDYGLDEAIAESLRAVGAASDGDGHEHGEHHDHDHGHGCEGAHAAEADVRETKEQQAGEPAAAGPAVAPEAPEADYAQTARLLREILRNILREPDVAKFRRIKLDTLALRLQLAGLEFLENAGWEYVLGRTRAYEAAAEAAVQSGGVVALPSQGAAPPDAEQEWWMVYKSQDSAPAAALLAALGGELPAPASRNDDRGKRARGERGGDHSALAGTAGATATGLSADEELATALALSEREAQEAVDMELAMALTKSAPRDGGGA